jgi:hypothetical protein
MSKYSYEILMSVRLNILRKEEMSEDEVRALDQLLTLPHPHREQAFVQWRRNGTQKLIPHTALNPNKIRLDL